MSQETKTYGQACIELAVAVRKLKHAYLLAILGWLNSIQLVIAAAIVNQDRHKDREN